MATFTNFATLTYSGGTTNSNTVTGELLDTVTVTKTAVADDYTGNDVVTYVISIVNSGTSPFSGVTVTDDLGGYTFEAATLYPLEYVAGSVRYFINGTPQAAPAVTPGPPLVISGISIPAGGNATIIYEAEVTPYAPLAAGSVITNTASVANPEKEIPESVSDTITAEEQAELYISKALSPSSVSPGGTLSYTFMIANTGNTEATAEDDVTLTDTFEPVLADITVTFNGETWAEGTNYTYDAITGEFATVPGQITVPAATFTQEGSGAWTTTPGTATLIITGTITA
ncbi:MAG: hypothetical protein IKR21_03790 [Oscillospiraceae bacterium]|nr:hypothetical protein [Oscillospiraceae bacterium]